MKLKPSIYQEPPLLRLPKPQLSRKSLAPVLKQHIHTVNNKQPLELVILGKQ